MSARYVKQIVRFLQMMAICNVNVRSKHRFSADGTTRASLLAKAVGQQHGG